MHTSTRFAFHEIRGRSLHSPFDKPVLSEVEGLRADGARGDCVQKPFVLSLSKHAGFSLLDLLITLLVLALILLAAVKQFGVYQKPARQPASQEQPAAAPPSAPSP